MNIESENRILIVEDEIKLAKLLADYFTQAQFSHHCIHDGLQVVDWVKQNNPDAIVLDIMLPGKDGLQICKEIRQFTDVPILMLTARVEEIDKLLGLEIGADDYICKPFSPKEVIARVKSVLRRSQGKLIPETSFKLDETRFEVNFKGQKLALTVVEFQLLKPLFSEPGRIFQERN